MAPGLVDEILAGMARGHDLRSTFAARHDMVPSGRDRALTENARNF